MLVKKQGFPKKGDLVKGKVKKILPHCAYVELIDYKNREGMLHISEISTDWVKDIKNRISKGEELTCKVTDVDREENQISLSLEQISKEEKRERRREIKLEKRAEKILKTAVEKAGAPKDRLKELEKEIYKDSLTLSGYLELAREEDAEVFKEVGASDELMDVLDDILKERKEKVEIKEKIKAISMAGDGINRIKGILTSFEDLEISYLGSSKYLIRLETQNYKKGQKKIDKAIKKMRERGAKQKVKIKKISK